MMMSLEKGMKIQLVDREFDFYRGIDLVIAIMEEPIPIHAFIDANGNRRFLELNSRII
jgi:hypothetical protein